jgi:hypothetical protein
MNWTRLAAYCLTCTLLIALPGGSTRAGTGPARLDRLPLDFVENRGQWPAAARFVAQKGPLSAVLEPGGIQLSLGTGEAVRLVFEGAMPSTTLAGEARRPGVYNFYLGDQVERWASNVPAFASVLYRDLYKGVDLRVREDAGRLEYDLLLAAGADLDQVVVRGEGVTGLRVEPDGSLVLDTPNGPLRQTPPRTWTVGDQGEQHMVTSRFRRIDDTRYGFEVPDRKLDQAMVIDPGLEWSTFIGGSADDTIGGVAAARDGSGDVFVAGSTVSTDFPMLADPSMGPNFQNRVFVLRLDAAGSRLVYATFVGGWFWQGVYRALAVNAAGEAAVAGETYSPDFPTTPNAFDRNAEAAEAFAFKLNALGGLAFSTFLGGRFYDSASAVGFDPAGSIVVGGNTSSDDFPTTPGAYDRTYNVPNAASQGGAHGDMFIARVSADGSQLTYGTFLGGPSMDVLEDLAIDPNGFVTVVGWVTGNNVQTFIPTAGAFDTTWNGSQDSAVARLKLDGAGTADLKYATLLGGSNQDNLDGVAFAPSNPALVTVVGDSWSDNFPTTPGVVKPTNPRFSALFESQSGTITRFNFPATGGGSLVWSSYFVTPGPTGERVTDVTVNQAGEAIVAGLTSEPDFPTQRGSLDRIQAGTNYRSDAFVARVNLTGTQLLYSTYLGGADSETDSSLISPLVALASGNSVFVASSTNSFDFRTTTGTVGPTHAGNLDAFVVKLDVTADASGDVTVNPPVLLLPADGAVFSGTGFAHLQWAPVSDPSGIESYEYQLSSDPAFPPEFIFYRGGISDTDAFTGEPLGTTTWFWRVRAADRAGNLSAWSPARTFTLGASNSLPVVSAIGTQPTSVPGGGTATGIVYFNGLIPPGGATVNLFIQNSRAYAGALESAPPPAAVSVPATITAPAGATQVGFPITTTSVNEMTNVDIMASMNGVARNGGFIVTLPATVTPARIEVRPMTLVGGNAGTGKVILSGPAPAGGALVTLQNSHPATAQIPAGVNVPAGATEAEFPINTSPVTTDIDATLTAIRGGVRQSVFLRVRKAGHPPLTSFTVSPTSVASGGSATGTLTFAGPVPAGIWPAALDAFVNIVSSDPNVAGVGGNFGWVAAGASSGTFSIYTQGIPMTRTITLTAHFDGTVMSAPLTVQAAAPVTLTSVTLDPSTVDSSWGGIGRVNIATPAPAGGVLITLGNSNPAALTIPANVSIGSGSTQGMFAFTTASSVSSTTTATVTASFGPSTASASVTIQPAGARIPLASIAVSPSTVSAGATATGTATLSAPARPGGVVVQLSASNLAAAVPASINVPAGATSANFTVTTSSVSSPTGVILYGLADNTGLSQSTGLTINPGAGTQPPGAPSLLSPAQDARPAQPVAFDWTDSSGATSYTIQIDDSSTISSPFVATQTVSVSQTSIGGLPSRRLWWRVRASNAAGNSAWSATRSFDLTAAPPASSLSAVSLSPSTVVGGNSSQGTVTLTSAAPSGGLVVTLASSNSTRATVPANVTVSAGSTSAAFTVTTSSVSASTSVTITASHNAVTRSATLTINPPSTGGPLAAPSLVSPAHDARFSPGQSITFDWNNVTDAASYTIQIDDSESFSTPLVFTQTVTASQLTTSTLPTTRMWWRVRANSASGAPGNWSSMRRFEVKD